MKIGIIGTSAISEKFIEAVSQIKECKVVAILSRSEEKGKNFCEKYNISKNYTDIDKFLADINIEAVYIASPNKLHYSQVLKALEYKKAILCEKPFVLTSQEFDTLTIKAKDNSLTMMEAMRTTLNPNFKIIQENLKNIAPIRQINLNFCQYSSRYDLLKKGELTNIFDKTMGGGALYDIGVYPLYFLLKLFGKPEEFNGFSYLIGNGVEGCGNISLKYLDKVANINYSKIGTNYGYSEIIGEKGSIIIEKLSDLKGIILKMNDGITKNIEISTYDNDLIYEIIEFSTLYETGKIQSDTNDWNTSRNCIEIMEKLANNR